jgi:hypothetical protein
MQAMFELVTSLHSEGKGPHEHQLYSKHAVLAMEALALRPEILRQTSPPPGRLFEPDSLELACMAVTDAVVGVAERE